jgi:hypothetical protein
MMGLGGSRSQAEVSNAAPSGEYQAHHIVARLGSLVQTVLNEWSARATSSVIVES